MRSQRRAPATVTLVHIVTTKDDLGDETEDSTETEVAGAIFEPERVLERTSNDQAPVLQPAVWNVPGVHDIDSDDLIQHGDDTWQVIGQGLVWLDRTKIPVARTKDV